MTIVACMCWGLGIIGFGLSRPRSLVAILFLMLASASDMVSGLYRDTILKTVTPDEMRGRMEGVSLSVVGTGPSIGNAEAGIPRVAHDDPDLDRLGWDRVHHRRRDPGRRPSALPPIRRGEPLPVGTQRIFRNTGGRIRSPPARSEDHSAGGASVRRASASSTAS